MGWVYLKCNHWINSLEETEKNASLKSFVRAIEDELSEYYKLVAGIDAQIKHGPAETLTLRTLTLLEKKESTSIFQTLDEFSKYGDKEIYKLVSRIMTKSAQPIVDMILMWVFEGELKDIYHEFFIVNNEEVTDYDQFWSSKYLLRKEKSILPPFISSELAELILRVGKSINLLRKSKDILSCTKVHELHQIERPKIINNSDEIRYSEVLLQIIQPVALFVDKQLLSLIFDKFKIKSHIKALKSYVLLSRGDFANHLMESLWPELNKPISEIYKHNLMRILESVVQNSSAHQVPKGITDCLKIFINNQENGKKDSVGWKYFSLEYSCSDPEIELVLTSNVRKFYYKAFNLVWRVKRVAFTLKLIWELQNSYKDKLTIIHEALPLIHRCQLLRNEMRNFIDHLLDHFFNVIAQCWAVFEKKVLDIKNLDDFINAHDVYLESIIYHLVLDKNEKQKLRDLMTLFELIERFQQDQQDLTNDLFAFANHRKLQLDKSFENLSITDLGDDDEDVPDDEEERKFNDRLTNIHIPKFNKCYKDFRLCLGRLKIYQINLENEGYNFGEEVALKLDFNSYYSKTKGKTTK